MFNKFISTGCLLAISFMLSVATSVNGYGLKVVSWEWLIGGFLGQLLILIVGNLISKEIL